MAKGKRGAVAEELDLVPIMNLVTILIPFLLMAAQFVSYAVIDSTLPAIGPPQTIEDQEDEEEPLNLSVFITDKGFTVAGSAAVLKSEGGGEEEKKRVRPSSAKLQGASTLARGMGQRRHMTFSNSDDCLQRSRKSIQMNKMSFWCQSLTYRTRYLC